MTGQPMLDRCWNLIRVAAGTSRGTRGRILRMSRPTVEMIMRERRIVITPNMIYGVSVRIDNTLPLGEIELTDPRDVR